MRPPFAFWGTVQDRPNRPGQPGKGPELRRAISRPTWLANRARNALQRPTFIGAISAGTFVTALVSMIVVPRTQQQAPLPTLPRPDTLSVAANAALARVRLVSAESTLVAARARIAADSAAAPQVTVDTLAGLTGPVADSIGRRVRTLDSLRLRTVQAPLAVSYRALAAAPELRNDPRVTALVDSLAEIERDKESFGGVGGVDPVFVALTTRANEVGRAIQAIANERRTALLAQLQPAAPPVPTPPPVDTTAMATSRDSARTALEASTAELTRRRAATRNVELEEERARERASAVAPPLALLAAAFVLSAVIGFAVAFIGELRKPRVSDAAELQRYLGVRVLSTIEAAMPTVERGRRQADRSAPPYFDPGAEGYQLAYLTIGTEHPEMLTVTVTGDHAGITAVIGCNMAAVAAEEARSTLVIDLDPTCSGSAALRAPAQPGIVDLIEGGRSWPDVTLTANVGRDKSVAFVPHGVSGRLPSAEELIAVIRDGAERTTRYYDAVFVLATASEIAAGLPAVLPSPEVIYCAQPGITPLRQLRSEMERIRAAGGSVRGIMLWHAERPLLPTPRELTGKRAKPRPVEPKVAVAT